MTCNLEVGRLKVANIEVDSLTFCLHAILKGNSSLFLWGGPVQTAGSISLTKRLVVRSQKQRILRKIIACGRKKGKHMQKIGAQRDAGGGASHCKWL